MYDSFQVTCLRGVKAQVHALPGYREGVVEDRWVIGARHRGRGWEVIMGLDWERRLLVVVTAYAVWE